MTGLPGTNVPSISIQAPTLTAELAVWRRPRAMMALTLQPKACSLRHARRASNFASSLRSLRRASNSKAAKLLCWLRKSWLLIQAGVIGSRVMRDTAPIYEAGIVAFRTTRQFVRGSLRSWVSLASEFLCLSKLAIYEIPLAPHGLAGKPARTCHIYIRAIRAKTFMQSKSAQLRLAPK